MRNPPTAPYGSWKSPITAKEIAEGTLALSETMADGGKAWWVEMRPAEGGRHVVMRQDAGGVSECVPKGFNVRTRVHEYGGGAYLPVGDELFFVHFADQRLYRAGRGGAPEPVTPGGDVRYGDFVWDERRSRLVTVQEDHRGGGEAVNSIAAIYPGEGGRAEVLASGNDFYSSPRISPDGGQLAFLTWNHPNMPWDAAELWTAPMGGDGSVGRAVHVAGGVGESVAQPEWSGDGVLHFASDRTDWWNLYRLRNGTVEALTSLEAEFAGPQWNLRPSTYGFDGPERIITSYGRDGAWRIAKLDTRTLKLEPVETPYSTIAHLRVNSGRAVFIGGSPSRPAAVVAMDLETGKTEELRRAAEREIDAGYLSTGEAVEFPTEGGVTAHGFFHAPRNRDFVPTRRDEKPPLVVMVHGGPTGSTATALRMSIQYYTSRGIAVLDVNYGGSTGYGRKYRERLAGKWGVVDVDDACNGAKHLAAAGRVDGRRLAITGGSAGGYTALSCLAFRKVFAAGASHFGISDCEALAKETHKFESRYLDRLIGPYPERRDIYVERSPIHHVEGLSCPVIFFQGLDDKIVPPNQAQRLVDALRENGLPVAHVEFEGESHGFRKAENIRRAIEGEFYFFSRIFGFTPADALESVKIDNL
jgi:dipeptidyl aminopeptidase/acylaminoacyl peptidase